MVSERKFTLEEATAELRRRVCRDFGHAWQVLEGDGVPYRISCSSCGLSYRVEVES